MTFHDWMKNINPAKKAELDTIAREAEIQREIDEDALWDELCEEDKTGWEYEFTVKSDE